MSDNDNDIMSDFAQGKRSRRVFGLHWLHLFVVIASLAITIFAYSFTKKQIEEKALNRFDFVATRTTELVSERMEKYEEALWAGVATIYSQSYGMDYEEWKRFAAQLKIEKRYPGINGIGVIKYVPKNEIQEYLEAERQLRPDFNIHPPHDGDEYLPITYIEPVQNNMAAVGLDMAHESNRYAAALKARETGESQITAPITLVQDVKKTPGFLFYAPFYDGPFETVDQRLKNFAGMVYAPFIMENLMSGTLEKQKREVDLHIYDDDKLLYSDDPENNNKSLFTKTIDVPAFGRQWRFEIESNELFETSIKNNQPYVILFGGFFIDGLLLLVFILLSRSNYRAVKRSEEIVKKYKEKERDLNTAVSFQKAMLDNIPDIVFVKNELLEIVHANPAFLEVCPPHIKDRIEGREPKKIPDIKDIDPFFRFDKFAFEEGVSETNEVITLPDGKKRSLYTKKVCFQDANNERFVLGIARDITDRQYMEDALRQNQKMEALGQLSGGIAHEINNFLQPSLMAIELLERNLSFDQDAERQMHILSRNLTAAIDVVKDILRFSHQDEVEPERLNLKDTIKHAVDFSGNLLPSSIQIQWKVTGKEAQDACAYVNENHMISIVSNMLKNAADAMKGKGKVSVSYGCTTLLPRMAENHSLPEGLYGVLTITDTGEGISKENLSKIFDPFFTTKPVGDGTGLGLSTAYGILQNWQGTILVDSILGKGTTFQILIPIIEEEGST